MICVHLSSFAVSPFASLQMKKKTPPGFSEILHKFRPEIDRFKGGHYLKLPRSNGSSAHCLLHTPSRRNGTRIDLSRFFHADSRIVDAPALAFGAQLQQRFDVRPAAAPQSSTMASGGRLQKRSPHAAIALWPKFIMETMIFPPDLRACGCFQKDITPPSFYLQFTMQCFSRSSRAVVR